MDWPIPHRRQRGRRVTAKAVRRQGAISAPEMASSTKLQAGSQLLIKSSWDPAWLTSSRRVAADISSPKEKHGPPERVFPLHTQEPERRDREGDETHHTGPPGPGKGAKRRPNLCGVPKNLVT